MSRSRADGRKTIPRKARQDQLIPREKKSGRQIRSLRSKKKRHTPEEQAHLDKIGRMKCIASEIDNVQQIGRTNIHHIREGYKSGQRASHWETLPLCEGSHQGLKDNTRLAFHKARRTWCHIYGNEIKLLAIVLARVGLTLEDIPRLRGSNPPWWDRYQRGGYDEEMPESIRKILILPQEDE